MKKALAFALSLAMVFSMTGCGKKEKETEAPKATTTEAATEKTTSDEVYKVALVIAGTLGDKSFYDSANSGLEMLKEELGDGFEFKV